ncbi:hypothetical protein Syun_028742 [Stephania yunnanensis]|uniref:PUM-HD domain-containing protein n=1 Tax=Stephania yunnanensis TaxID=152371 RepID=A0AAP0EC27_9MAGN
MAAKNQSSANTTSPKKRKRVAANAKSEGAKAVSKKPKFSESKSANPPNKASKKPFKSSSEQSEKKLPKSKRELRLQAKELAEARKKKRKRHYSLEQELASLWEKMRRHNIAKEERSKLVSEAMRKMKGTIPEIAGSHVSSRVLQTCVKYCSQAERDAVFEELRPHFLTLACNTYAVHLLKKMLDNASKKQLEAFISTLHGHVVSLLRNMVGSVVVEHAYQLGNAAQKQSLLLQLYSKELQLFKDLHSTKEKRLVDLIPKLGLNKSSVQRELASVIQPILEKGIVDHSIIHRALLEYLSIADKSSATDVIEQLSGPLLVRMIGTRDGAKLGMLCIKHGGAKGRKKIIKGMKGHVGKIAHDQYGCMVLVSILSMVDDTKLLSKVAIRELQPILKELVFDKSGRRPLLQLLHPNSPRYLGVDDLATLSSFYSFSIWQGNAIFFLLSFGEGSVDNSEADKQMIPSEVDKSVKGESDKEDAVADNKNTSKSPEESLHSVSKYRFDPLFLRYELAVATGGAEIWAQECFLGRRQSYFHLQFNLESEVNQKCLGIQGKCMILRTINGNVIELNGSILSFEGRGRSEWRIREIESVDKNFIDMSTIRLLVYNSLMLLKPAFTIIYCWSFSSTCVTFAPEGKSTKKNSKYVYSSDSLIRKAVKRKMKSLVDLAVSKVGKL